MWVCVAYGDVHWFNIIGSCERWSTLGLIKNRQHREAIWHCVRREDKLSVLWPNKCFHFILATRPVWSGMTGMLSLPRSIHYSQLSAGLHLNSPPASVPVLKAQTDIHTHSKSLVNLFSFIHVYTCILLYRIWALWCKTQALDTVFHRVSSILGSVCHWWVGISLIRSFQAVNIRRSMRGIRRRKKNQPCQI